MATTAVSVLEERLSQQAGDWLEVIVTTAIAANNSIISTNLQSFDGGRDDYYNDFFVYITDKANAAVQRQISDYATATGTLTVRGAALLTDGANLATIRLHRYNRDHYIRAFNDACRELFPQLYKSYDIIELVTNNILPNAHFRDWAASANPDKWSVVNATAAATTTAGLVRGGAKSAKVTASAANGYMLCNSDDWTRLLDLKGQSVSAFAWAYPEVANDATIVLYTKKADGTEQTLTSTTTCPAGEWTLLKLENQSINDDIVDFQFRLKIATNAKYVYFDNARLLGPHQLEYLLPTDIQNGRLGTVKVQSYGYSDYWADDLMPHILKTIYGWDIIPDGTDKFLCLPLLETSNKLLRLEGYAPLSTVSAYTDTIEIGGEYVNKFIAYAKWKLMEMIEAPVATRDIGRYETAAAKAYREYQLLDHLTMPQPRHTLNLRGVY